MVNLKLVLLGIAIMIVIFGLPDQINLGFGSWCIKNCNKEPIVIQTTAQPTSQDTQKPKIPVDFLSVEKLDPRQKIYSLGENATIDFIIEDQESIPYNFTVNWYLNDTRFYGWSGFGKFTNPFYSWYPVNQKGDWKVQVVLLWTFLNRTYSKDATASFKVA